jgi:hypothetical protein
MRMLTDHSKHPELNVPRRAPNVAVARGAQPKTQPATGTVKAAPGGAMSSMRLTLFIMTSKAPSRSLICRH